MLRGLYSVAGAMESAARNQEIIADNLANVTTPGFRRQGLVFDVGPASNTNTPENRGTPSSTNAGNQTSFTRFDSGPLEQTNSPFDLALVGDAFFVLDGPNGPVYTRNGVFGLSPSGELQSRGAGYRVRGQGGALTVPANAGPVTVAADGTLSTNGAEIGRLQLARFARPETMRRVGSTLFEGDAPEAPQPGSVRVEQGYREGSNVQAVEEMVSMMVGMRFYEAAERAMRALSDVVGQNTRVQNL